MSASVVVIGPVGESKAPGNNFRELPSMQLLTAYLLANDIRADFVWGTTEEVLLQIGELRPSVVAMTSFWNSGHKALAERILRIHPSIKVAIGGYDVTGRHAEGENPKNGETWFIGPAFGAFLKLLGKPEPWPAIVYGSPNEPSIRTMPPPIRVRELITGSDFKGRLSFPAPSQITGVASLTGSIGCPGACTFCLNALMNGCHVERRDPWKVAREALDLVDLGAILIYMTDEDVSSNRIWLHAFCRALIDVDFGDRASIIAGVRAGELTLEDLQLMKAAGVSQLGAGVEWTEKVRKELKRNSSASDDQLRQFSQWCKIAGVITMGFVLTGPWCKTKDEMRRGIQEIAALGFDELSCSEVLAFRGTELSLRGWHGEMPNRETLQFRTTVPNPDELSRRLLKEHYHSRAYENRVAAKVEKHAELERSFRETRPWIF